MTVVVSALAFLLLLSVLILIHEWGHFAAARKAGVIVEEFGFGLPPRAKKLFRSRGGTIFSLNWIPFGGFVRLRGENAATDHERRDKGNFAAASIGARCVILLAGVFMNFLLAILIFSIGFSAGHWIPTYITAEEMEQASARGEIHLKLAVLVEEVIGGMSAAKAGVPTHAIITAVNGKPVSKPSDVTAAQEGSVYAAYTVTRKLEDGTYSSKPETFSIALKDGKSGVVLRAFPLELSAPLRDPLHGILLGFRETKVVTVQTVLGIGRLVLSLLETGRIPEGIAGIVGIAQLTHASVQQGFMTYLRLVAILSLSLAVLNVLPFPALDGGRLLFVLAEFVARRPVNRRFEVTANAVGFVLLILLILFITFNDILRLF